MTATTANFALRYPQSTDKPCDGGDQIRALRDDIYGHLDTFLTDALRQKSLPMVSVTYNGPLTYNQLIPWNAVEQDDVEAVDLIVQRNAIFLGKGGHPDRIGTYIYGTSYASAEDDSLCTVLDVILTPNTFDARAYDIQPGNTFTIFNGAPWLGNSALLKVPSEVMVQVNSLCSGANMFARLWAVRIGEP
jgi:hypothetical protein